MMQQVQQVAAWLLLTVYVPLTVALPLFHHHEVEHESSTWVYEAADGSVGHDDHSHDCDACKFTSSHSLAARTTWVALATEAALVVPVGIQYPVRTPGTLHSPRAPPHLFLI